MKNKGIWALLRGLEAQIEQNKENLRVLLVLEDVLNLPAWELEGVAGENISAQKDVILNRARGYEENIRKKFLEVTDLIQSVG